MKIPKTLPDIGDGDDLDPESSLSSDGSSTKKDDSAAPQAKGLSVAGASLALLCFGFLHI